MLASKTNFPATARNSVWLLVVPAARMMVGFSVGLLVTRHLGPTQYGALSEALALLTMLAPLGDIGLSAFLRTELLAERFSSRQLLGTILALRVVGGVLSMLFAVGLAWNAGRAMIGLTVAASLTLLSPALLTPEQLFTSQLKSRVAAVIQLAGILVAAAIRVALVLTNGPLIAFAACFSVEAAVIGIGLWSAVRTYTSGISIDVRIVGPALRASIPLLLTVLALAAQNRVDQLILVRTAGPAELGLYAGCVRFSELVNVVLTAISLSLLPLTAARHAADPTRPEVAIQPMLDALVTGALAWAIFCSASAWWWVPKLLGASFSRSGAYLALHGWVCVFQAMGISRSTLWTLQQRNHLTLVSTFVGSATTVALAYFVVPRFGTWGCVFCALVGAAMTNVITTPFGPAGRVVLAAQLSGMAGGARLWRQWRQSEAPQ